MERRRKWLTVTEAAQLLGMTRADVYRQIEEQRLPGQVFGRCLLLSRDQVEARRRGPDDPPHTPVQA